MEKGFYNTTGYWQTPADVPDHILAAYPKGTIEVPLRPSENHAWNGTEWVYVAPPPLSQAEQESKRQSAYTAEADPLFFKWQAGEATEAEWLAKREEIRARFPYPEEV
jgi:hypothetical protein